MEGGKRVRLGKEQAAGFIEEPAGGSVPSGEPIGADGHLDREEGAGRLWRFSEIEQLEERGTLVRSG